MIDKDPGTSKSDLSKALKPLNDAGTKVIVVRIGNEISQDKAKLFAMDERNILGLNNSESLTSAADKVIRTIIEGI